MSEPLEAVARRCFERQEARGRQSDSVVGAGPTGVFVPTLVFVGLWVLLGQLLQSALAGFLLALGPTLVLLPVIRFHSRMSRRLAAFRAGDPDVTVAVCEFAVEEFRGQIERHRARTLGQESEWAVARGSLVEAVDDAQRSEAYWRVRLGQDPANDLFAGQLKTATELGAKLRSALGKLDGRADVLLRFYNDCDARIAVIDRYNRDIEETRRLDRLSGTAEMVVAGAEAALAGIGASFVREAGKVGEVLGTFERLQLKSLAGAAPLDDIEFLADRINASSDREYDTVERLSRTMGDLSLQ